MTGPAGETHTDPTHAVRERWSRLVTVLRAPRVTIEVYGDAKARSVYEAFTARHPRFIVTSAKRWGVALLRLPDTYDMYLKSRKTLRRNSRRAEVAGYRYAIVRPSEHLEAIVEINCSTPVRQGRPMQEVDLEWAARSFGSWDAIHGILDGQGRLRAYATVLRLGDAYAFSSLIGHAEHLHSGVMYLLVSRAVGACINARGADGAPYWLMADTFWGSSEGLAYFKRRVGFEPHTVRWVWTERDSP